MIRLIFSGQNWGTDPLQEQHPETGEIITGRQINLLDPESKILAHVPFSGDSLAKLIAELAQGLTPDQRRELAPHFTGGIHLPNGQAKLSDFRPGPQG